MSFDMSAAAKKQAETARQAVLHLEEITRDPMKVQEEFLLKLIDDNKDTEYGRKYGFSDIHSIDEYRHRVPVTTYDDYAPYIERMSEKTTEAAVRTAAEMTAERCGFELVESSMYPDIDNSRYVYLLEIDKVPQELTCDMVRDTLEDCLAQVNPSMGDKVKKGICAPTGLLFSQPETFILYREMLQMNGYSVGQTKPVTVITNEFQRRFFFRMTETFEEIRSICAAGSAK